MLRTLSLLIQLISLFPVIAVAAVGSEESTSCNAIPITIDNKIDPDASYLGCSSDVTGGYNFVLSADERGYPINSSYLVKLRRGAYDPRSMIERNLPVGGVNFRKKILSYSRDDVCISYSVYFDKDFEFVEGGKLPGLYGGQGNSGGVIPNGYDGFSVRLVWTAEGGAKIYAYLPTSKVWGSGFLIPDFQFRRNSWTDIEICINLNQPSKADGVISFRSQGSLYSVAGLTFRHASSLGVDGVLFSVFHGGNTPKFAPLNDHWLGLRFFSIYERPRNAN